ncbi:MULTISPECIES: STAS domain-containing protein [unclassified Streptomyces]|jgi:stage II sporulation protein AA (anti-sigma F factor antagonist)|uniref:STAS domain-containing protein n=1 Tax=unclassified Streptomyces TaxID=2593676 RepID=UPI003317ED5D
MAEEEVSDAEQLEQLSIVATATNGIHVLTVAGEIDHHTGDALSQALDLSGTSRPHVVVDLQQVAFMDSSGINVLIAAHRALSEAGGWLRLAGPTGPVLRTLQLVGLDTVIDCHETLDQALAD